MKRLTKEAWLDEGLNVLQELGCAHLTIEELTTRLNVTKGSFYHHFKNRQTFTEDLLSYWENQMTLDIIRTSEQGQTFEEKNKKLMNLSNKPRIYKLEVAIRAWALRDPTVQAFQKRIDKQRLTYLNRLYNLFTENKEQAECMALIRYCFATGAQQLVPNVKGKKFKDLLETLHTMFADLK